MLNLASMKVGRGILTGWVAASVLMVFETLWVVVLEREQPVGYFALGFGLILGSSTLVALVFSIFEEAPRWTAAGLAAAGAGLHWGPLSAITTFVVLTRLLRFRDLERVHPIDLGISAAVGLGFSAIVMPRLLTRVSILGSAPEWAMPSVLTGLLIVTVFAFMAISHEARRHSSGRWVVLALAIVFLSLAGLPALTQAPYSKNELPGPQAASVGPDRPHVVLLVLDTVRADHLTLYGYERPTTPRLEAFFEARPRAAIFPSVYANSNWTVPSHASLFTGLLPAQHGVHFGSGSRLEFSLAGHETLAERMSDAGYRSVGIYANPWLGNVEGMENGFDVYRSPIVPRRLPMFGEALRRRLLPGAYPMVFHSVPRGDAIVEEVEAELLACGDEPCFVFANLIDAHSYYVADQCRGKFAQWSLRERISVLSVRDEAEQTERLMARYDEEICELDRTLGEMLSRLESAGVLDETWVMITSDHGEAFGAHENTEHGSSVYNDQVWIPLLVIPPSGSSIEATTAPGSLVDITATIAAIGGAQQIGVGRDLRRPAGPDAEATIEFYGDPAKRESQNPRAADPARAITRGDRKLVEQSGRLELFDLRADPHETSDLAAKEPASVADLEDRLPELRFVEDSDSDERELPAAVIEQLRELGYAD